ncbi:hypothetical protein MTR67_000748 [Solanum verrucosum]|uniref:RNase III domain-containing protein n=1 Tax=Solanum verrucosum TaxID=315347 RepID=A0AAF0PLY7_SOLVR|nr:hypothetical protein MTR67_000748 [Solanum verrucosum]
MIASPIKFKGFGSDDNKEIPPEVSFGITWVTWRLFSQRCYPGANLCVKIGSPEPMEIRSKSVADVLEALIGAYLSSGGEVATLSFMKWIAMDIDFIDAPILRHFLLNAEKLVNHLEFLGDVVLGYVISTHLYFKYLRLNPRIITYLRSTFVNNKCYAQSAVKASMHKHILHALSNMQRHICCTTEDFEKLDLCVHV